MGSKFDESTMTEFQKRAIDLLVHKCIEDYARTRKNSPGEELEHFYEGWSRNAVAECYLQDIVWHKLMTTLRTTRGKHKGQ
jgi:hypothetical protein